MAARSKVGPKSKTKTRDKLKFNSRATPVKKGVASGPVVSLALSTAFPLCAKVNPAMTAYTGYCLVKSAQRFRHLMDRGLSKIDLHMPSYVLLRVLSMSGPLMQNELGAEVGVDKTTMVKLIDELENGGLVGRALKEGDRRARVIALTKRGEKKVQEAFDLVRALESQSLSLLTKPEQEQLHKLLLKLIQENKSAD